MSEQGRSLSQKRFSGDGNDGASLYKTWKRWAKAAVVVQRARGTPEDALGPWLYTLLDGQAALAVQSLGLAEISGENGEEVVFNKLDERFPDKVAADRLGEAMEEAFTLKILKHETTEAYTRRARLVFAKLSKEGVDLPRVAARMDHAGGREDRRVWPPRRLQGLRGEHVLRQGVCELH